MTAELLACRVEHLPGVADLFIAAFEKGAAHSAESIVTYFTDLYLGNPWAADDVPSVVAVDRDRVVGFIGVVPMPVRIDGRVLRVAVGGNFMVDRDHGDPMLAGRLLRRYLSGPQDLSFTDTASDEAIKLWNGLGGVTCRFSSLRWLVPLRAGALAQAGARRVAGPRTSSLARPFVNPVDRASRRRLVPAPTSLRVEAADVDRVHAVMTAVGGVGYAHPDTVHDLAWLVGMCRRKQQFGPLRSIAFVDANGKDAGVALYYPNRGELGQVVLLLATKGRHGEVLDTLLRDAAEHGSAAMFGQADPMFMLALGERVSTYVQRNEFVTVRAGGGADVSAVVPRLAAGDIALSRLIGEWWTRMQGDTF